MKPTNDANWRDAASVKCYLGIDLTSSDRRPSAWAALDATAGIVGLGRARTDADILALTERLRPSSIAIDAPLFLPKGLTTLDDPTAAVGLPTGRACERALKALGIGCFYTIPHSIIRNMVYRAIALRLEMEARGLVVLEVFPYATKVRLFGTRTMPRKTRACGLTWLRQQVARYIPDTAMHPDLSHDDLDALLAAYTGLLHGRGLAEGIGEADEGLLWLPTATAGGIQDL